MATKTISIDREAYNKLVHARLRPSESFSKVIKRARWDAPRCTSAALLQVLESTPCLSNQDLNLLEAAQEQDRPPEDQWSR